MPDCESEKGAIRLEDVYFKFRSFNLAGHARPKIIAKAGKYFIAAGF
jgi:hypothetical protein